LQQILGMAAIPTQQERAAEQRGLPAADELLERRIALAVHPASRRNATQELRRKLPPKGCTPSAAGVQIHAWTSAHAAWLNRAVNGRS